MLTVTSLTDTTHHDKPALAHADREREVVQQLRYRQYLQPGVSSLMTNCLRDQQTYEMTHDELVWAARMAWRNAPRCPARVIWKNLTVFDKRLK